MPFEFQCPCCGAASRVDEDTIGVTGPCYACGADVTIFPPESRVAPPKVLRIALLSAFAWALIAMALFVGLRAIPTWVALQQQNVLTSEDIWGELVDCLAPTLIGLILGGLLYGGAALVVHSGQGYVTMRRAIWIGHLLGAIIGLGIGLYLAAQNPSVNFFPQGEQIAAAMLGSMLVIGFFAAGVGLPWTMHVEKRLVRRAAFTAPPSVPRTLQATAEKDDQVITAAVAAPPAETHAEITSSRRQELIRRLGIVHQQDESEGESPDLGDRARRDGD